MRILGIFRDERFSPNSVQKDRDIMLDVLSRLSESRTTSEEEAITIVEQFDLILNMGRLPSTMSWLKQQEDNGARVVNSARGVEACRRSKMAEIMKACAIPTPSEKGNDGYWIKRGDAATQQAEDVKYCANKIELEKAKKDFVARGINNFVVQAHVQGDLIKFYGVEHTGFFSTFYPGDDGITKFGNEIVNGRPHHYVYDVEKLRVTAELLSRKLNTPVFGGDAIVTPAGDFFLIDFNDWPSFSRCRNEAANAIARLVKY